MSGSNGNGARWVTPYEKYPKFRIQYQELSPAEEAAIADGFKVGRRSGELGPQVAFGRELAKRQILGWEGVPEQVTAVLGITDEVTDAAKDKFLEPRFFDKLDDDGNAVRKSLWVIVRDQAAAEQEINLKN